MSSRGYIRWHPWPSRYIGSSRILRVTHRGDHDILDVFIDRQVYSGTRDLHLLLDRAPTWTCTLLICSSSDAICIWRGCACLFRIGTALCSGDLLTIFRRACWLIRHLMIVHSDKLIDQVAKLSLIAPVNLVSASPTHGWLFVFKLLLQYIFEVMN